MRQNIKRWFTNHPFLGGLLINGVFWLLITIASLVKTSIEEEKFFDSFKSVLQFSIPLWIILIIVFVSSIIVIVVLSKRFKYDEDTLEMDRNIFYEIKDELLPQKGSMMAVREFDSAIFYRNKELGDLRKFENKMLYSDFEFFNPELERLKQELHVKIKIFYDNLRKFTVPKENDIYIVLPEVNKYVGTRYREIVTTIDDSADQVRDAYDELIREGRKILKT